MPLDDFSIGIDVTDHGVATGNSAADNQTALETLLAGPYLATIRDDFGSLPTLIFPAADAAYNFTGEIDVYGAVRIQGGAVSSRLGISSVTLCFASGAYAIRFMDSAVGDPLPGSFWAELRDVWVKPVAAGDVDIGVLHYTPMRFENVVCDGFKKAGFIGAGQTSGSGTPGAVPSQDETAGQTVARGNTNTTMYTSCAARGTVEGHGFIATGNNAAIMYYYGCDAKQNNGCGFKDNTTIGCSYINCHTSQNTWKVSHGGAFYACVKDHTADADNEPGVGVDWKEFWLPVTATIADETWALSSFFRCAGGINVVDDTAPNFLLVGCYTEGGIEVGFVPRGTGFALGGNYWDEPAGRAYIDGPDAGKFHSPKSIPRWQATDGTVSWGSGLGDTRSAAGNGFIIGHTGDTDVNSAAPAKNGIKLAFSNVRKAYEWIKGTSTRVMAFTAPGWTTTEGYSGGGNVLFEQGLILGGPGGRRQRFRCAPSITTIPASTVLIKGEILSFTTAAVAGDVVMGMVTKGGTVGSGGATEPVVTPFGVLEA